MKLQVRSYSSQSEQCKKTSKSSVSKNASHEGNKVFPTKSICDGIPGFSGELRKNWSIVIPTSNCHTNVLISKHCKYLLPLPFDSLCFISSMTLTVWLFSAYISLLKESKKDFHIKKNNTSANIWRRQ